MTYEKSSGKGVSRRKSPLPLELIGEIAAWRFVEECKKQGFAVKIGETFRTAAEQDALYAQGRTKPGQIVTNARGGSYQSQHQWGIAFDFYLNMDMDRDGNVSDDAYNDGTGLFKKTADIAKRLGLAWGGDWKSITDKPHLYIPDWGSTTQILKDKYGTPKRFMETWEKKKEKEPGWHQDSYGWWYIRKDGSYPSMGWELIDHHWYLFGKTGYMVTGWAQWDGEKTGSGAWYYLEEAGDYMGACWHAVPGGSGAMERWYVESDH